MKPSTRLELLTEEGKLRTLEDIEHEVLRFAIAHCVGQKSEAARQLGIGRSTLYRKLADLGIPL